MCHIFRKKDIIQNQKKICRLSCLCWETHYIDQYCHFQRVTAKSYQPFQSSNQITRKFSDGYYQTMINTSSDFVSNNTDTFRLVKKYYTLFQSSPRTINSQRANAKQSYTFFILHISNNT